MKQILLPMLFVLFVFSAVGCKGGGGDAKEGKGYDSPEAAAKALGEGLEKMDAKAIKATFPDSATIDEYLECPKGKEFSKEIDEDVEEMEKDLKKMKKKGAEFTFDGVGKTKESKTIKKDAEFEDCKVKKDFEVKKVKINFTIKTAKGKEKEDEGISVAKFGDKWFVVDD